MPLRPGRPATTDPASLHDRRGSGGLKLPRDVSGRDLADRLERLGYRETRQSGSHVRLTRRDPGGGEHHITIPLHLTLKIGTLDAVIRDVAAQLGLHKADLIEKLWGR